MSKNYCINIPDETFRDILKITKDRGLTIELWSLMKSQTAQQEFGIDKNMSAIELFRKLDETGAARDILSDESYSAFVTESEGLDNLEFDTYSSATNLQNDIVSKYKNVAAVINQVGDVFKIQAIPLNDQSKQALGKQNALEKLNRKLVDYIEQLGFSVKESEDLEEAGKFDPTNAERNADGLIQAINIAKGLRGQQALPEEIAHLLVEGFQNNPFMQRLMGQMDKQTVMDILGEQYNDYAKEYKDDEDLLKKEAVGRLVAQHLVDRNGIGDSIRFISDKMLNKMRDNLRKGYESEIRDFLSQIQDDVKQFIESTFGSDESIDFFDNKAVMNCQSALKHIDVKVKDLQSVAEQNYNIVAKRLKIMSLRQKDQKLTSKQIQEFNRMKDLMEKQDYYGACLEFVGHTLEDSNNTLENLKKLRGKYKEGNVESFRDLRVAAKTIRQAEDLIAAYKSPVQSMSSVDSIEEIQQQLPQEDIDKLKDLSSDVLGVISSIESITQDMRKRVLFKILQNYWGKDKIVKMSNGQEKTYTLQDVIESNLGETASLSRFLNSMADAGDPMLQLMDQMYKDFTNQRDQHIFSLQQELSRIWQDYVSKTGSRDIKFMFAKDENGKIIGNLISDRDFTRFHKEKSEFRKSLKQQGLDNTEIKNRLKAWDVNHTEMVNVAPAGNDPRWERMPRKDMYTSNDLSGLNQAQRDLYDKIIEIKKNLDYMLPSKYTHLYRAPMKKGSVSDQALSGGNIKGIFNRIKSRFVTSVSDGVKRDGKTSFGEDTQTDQSTEYGESVQVDQYKDGKHVVLDFSGKEIKKIPVFYTRWLDDMSALDTNLIDTMLSYGAMSLNYKIMNDLADFMELGNSQMQDREIIQTSGIKKMYERFKIGESAFQKDYTIPGANSNQAKTLRQYTDRNVYGLKKEKTSIIIGNQEVNLGNIADYLKSYSSVVGLGLNIFSGTTNLSMGMAQTLIQCAGNQYFGLKNIAHANKNYFKMLPNGIMGQYQDHKKDKLNLLIQKFDCLEEYYSQLDDNNFYGGIFKKMIGKCNPLIFNSMGEHYLHSLTMLAVLDRKKVKIGQDGKLMSLYEALESKETVIKGLDGTEEKVYQIEIPEGLLNEDGSKFTEEDMVQLKQKIQQVNHKMHGAFNDVDRGEINRYAIGRLLMQFRQWMPAFYTARFQRQRINVVTGETEEGFYRTYANFVMGLVRDTFHLKFNYITRFKNLTDSQRANVRMAFVESNLALLLMALSKMQFMAPDKDYPAYVNLLKYNVYRLKMELGSAFPLTPDFLDNVNTLVRSPLPCAEQLDRFVDLLDVTLVFRTVKSGRYEGWNKYAKTVYFATPMARNVGRFIDLMDGDISMFNPYRKTK